MAKKDTTKPSAGAPADQATERKRAPSEYLVYEEMVGTDDVAILKEVMSPAGPRCVGGCSVAEAKKNLLALPMIKAGSYIVVRVADRFPVTIVQKAVIS